MKPWDNEKTCKFESLNPTKNKIMRRLLLFFFMLFSGFGFSQNLDLETFYERSGNKETPRYKETLEYCRKLQAASPKVHLLSFGKSAQGRDLPLLIMDKQGFTNPVAIRKAGRTILLVEACIHPGESEGKDAGLLLIRDLITKKIPIKLLDKVSILFIPIFNVDGHERFGPYNRINQNGPKEMGWRVTATNLNLNRDFLKADTPEVQAWLTLFNRWLPELFIDVHTTDGADYQYVLTYYMDTSGNLDPEVAGWSEKTFLPLWTAKLSAAGIMAFPYIEFRDWHNPKSGLEKDVTPPMFSQGYTGFRNRPGLLLETHMLKSYEKRVNATYQALLASLEIMSDESAKITAIVTKADKTCSSESFRKSPFPLRFETLTHDSTMVDFLGIAYEEVKSSISGETWFKYGDKKLSYQLPYFSKTRPVMTIQLPEAYIIPAEWSTIIERMEFHGIRLYRLKRDTTLEVTTYKFSNPKWQANPYEGRHPLTNFSTEEIRVKKTFMAGSALVDLSQPSARIIIHMLEPKGMGSLVSWGFFDAIFEQKEYGEHYVIEPMAEKYLKDDPKLKAEFEQKMKSDSVFAKSADQILNWFYMKSPYWDQSKDIYPIGRIMERRQLEGLKKIATLQ